MYTLWAKKAGSVNVKLLCKVVASYLTLCWNVFKLCVFKCLRDSDLEHILICKQIDKIRILTKFINMKQMTANAKLSAHQHLSLLHSVWLTPQTY